MNLKLVLVGCLLALSLAGCGSEAEPTQWAGPPRGDDGGRVAVGDFNVYLGADGKAFARSPIAAVAEYLRLDHANAATTTLVAQGQSEAASPVTVVATLDRLLDDSVRAQRYVIGLERGPDGSWHLTSALVSYRCWPRRGHQVFSPARCV